MNTIHAGIKEGEYEEILAAVQSPVITLTELIKNASDSCVKSNALIKVEIDTVRKQITIEDNGEGFSEEDIKELGQAGYSRKMIDGNTQNSIGMTYSGNKGLGVLTAFFLADLIQIETFSRKDNCSYYIEWKKGEQGYRYYPLKKELSGTKVLLKGIEDEKLNLILLEEEKAKLFLTSLKFFKNVDKLPDIVLTVDNEEIKYAMPMKIDELYSQSKKWNDGFVAKASFRYSDNSLYLSYEDNILGYYTFHDQKIDFNDKETVKKFFDNVGIERSYVIGSISQSEVFNDRYKSVVIPDFEGVLYTWRGRKKNEEISLWPQGIKIYLNNYSIYRYLDDQYDWLHLSEISQNFKATNYKLKNTYGYVTFNDYNENTSNLKISKERNDFIDSMASRKFMHIMRDIVAVTFSGLDILIKEMLRKGEIFKGINLKKSIIEGKPGSQIDLMEYIALKGITKSNVDIHYPKDVFHIDSAWILTANKTGEFEIIFTYNNDSKTLHLIVEKTIPKYELTTIQASFFEGNTVNLRDFIKKESCVDVIPKDIIISAQSHNTKIEDDIFLKENSSGTHIISFKYGNHSKTLYVIVKPHVIKENPNKYVDTITNLSPLIDALRGKYYKITELIDGISESHQKYPTLCMAGTRVLLEVSIKLLFDEVLGTAYHGGLEGNMSRIMNITTCHVNNPDYSRLTQNKHIGFIQTFNEISHRYEIKLRGDEKKNIINHFQQFDLNTFVHNPYITTDHNLVNQTLRIFSPFLNYVFEVLLIQEERK